MTVFVATLSAVINVATVALEAPYMFIVLPLLNTKPLSTFVLTSITNSAVESDGIDVPAVPQFSVPPVWTTKIPFHFSLGFAALVVV